MGEDNVIRFTIGVFVSFGASFLDALGLNVLKLDHVKESAKEKQRGDCSRPLWHIGLYTYIGSQVIGSTIALNFLKTQWVAPLGSVALIFNFVFAKILVDTKITRKDVLGTCVVVASVIWIVVFGGMYNGEDPEDSISLESLKILFVRPIFIIYFSALNLIVFSGLFVSIWSNWDIENRLETKRHFFSNMGQKKMKHIVGLMFSVEGGLLASETLLLAKSGVKLFTLSVQSHVNQFNDNTSRFIILALIVTAVLQVYCLNTALKLYTSVVVVPVFYGTYTALGLVNTIIYLDEIANYPPWAIVLVFIGIAVLIYGVTLLSSKSDPAHLPEEEELQTITSPRWLSTYEEKSPVQSDASTSSSHPQEKKSASTLSLYKIKNLFKKKSTPIKETDTFISLHSQSRENASLAANPS
ncbi:magnesium transporter NIPA-domain-containing protein [Sporodiniella umbellata]|nr:magnesium transporter NIPA-domain-containing protein [Sporodiniella umbellata]